MAHSRDERVALAALLEQMGPDAPTLCEGWTTGDLAAHLVLRESRPDAAAGVMGGPVAPYTARMQQRLATAKSYAELVAAFRDGPPRLSVFAIPGADEAANTVEYFVHHEDVRRGGDDWEPRELNADLTEALWKRLKGARLFLRKLPVGVELTREDSPGAAAYRILKGGSPHVVTVTGTPAELTLWAMGRVTASRVRFDGPKAAINALQAWRRG
jgi:uncharacterized protein (TIGR03085 family)